MEFKQVQLKQIIELFDAGVLKECTVIRMKYPTQEWALHFSNSKASYQIELQRGGIATFKTLDAAIKVAKRVGFDHVQVSCLQ